MSARTASLAASAAVLLVAGCGVPTQDTATPLVIESFQPAGPGPEPTVRVSAPQLWFVQDDAVVERTGEPGPVTVGDLLEQLAVGPPDGNAATVRSLLTDPAHGGTLLGPTPEQASTAPAGSVTLIATDAFGALPADEQVLLLGQVVLTLCAAGAESVQIVDANGVPLAVPLPDGRLLDRAATADDYAALVLPQP